MKFKLGDSVEIPINTPVQFFSGSVLDKNPFKKGKMEYTGLGKISSINSKNVAVSMWNHNCENSWIMNFNPRYLKPTNMILGYNEKHGVMTVIDPLCPPAKNTKEYKVEGTIYHKDTLFSLSSKTYFWTLRAKNRKSALNKCKKFFKIKYKNEGTNHRARLLWKN